MSKPYGRKKIPYYNLCKNAQEWWASLNEIEKQSYIVYIYMNKHNIEPD